MRDIYDHPQEHILKSFDADDFVQKGDVDLRTYPVRTVSSVSIQGQLCEVVILRDRYGDYELELLEDFRREYFKVKRPSDWVQDA